MPKRVLILEENLMWSARLRQMVANLGYEVQVLAKAPDAWPEADLAIVNLGSRVFPPDSTVPELQARGMKILAHAGHKETELHELGRTLGCDRLATNSEMTHKLEPILTSLFN